MFQVLIPYTLDFGNKILVLLYTLDILKGKTVVRDWESVLFVFTSFELHFSSWTVDQASYKIFPVTFL